MKIIISGGGTGGHVFPAISIANALKREDKELDILFVGALERIEMNRVPEAGYKIIGLPVTGFQRRIGFQNLSFFFKLFVSMIKSFSLLKTYKPDAVVGVGGYASGPVLRMAGWMKIPTFIQEQNSYAGITNRLLAKRAKKIFVAYEGMEKYFPEEKIMHLGNPVRSDLYELKSKQEEALKYFNMYRGQAVVLVLGGSLGARTINDSIRIHIQEFINRNIHLIWQTGKYYFEEILNRVKNHINNSIQIVDFINRMDYAFSVADVVISRAGASTISELCIIGKPVVLVPSPNVAENHQTKNAMALVNKKAALMVNDKEAEEKLVKEVIMLLNDKEKMQSLSENIKKLAKPDSAKDIANEILKLVRGF
ncbi:undecaprenyldiphospho-muramoylpentapeptide beta-N-acetylglucosaminyltransferase [Bacteroidota bacterium]